MDYREPGPEFLVGPDFIGFGNTHAVTYKRNTNLVIPIGAKRSGGTCSLLESNRVLTQTL
jgi:hypothetical protein